MESYGPGERTGPAQDRESGREGKGSASRSAVSGHCLWWSSARSWAGRWDALRGRDGRGTPLPCPLRSASTPPPWHLGLCATQTVQLSPEPPFSFALRREQRVGEERKFLFLFTLKWQAILAAPGFPSLMSISGFWKNSVPLFIVK